MYASHLFFQTMENDSVSSSSLDAKDVRRRARLALGRILLEMKRTLETYRLALECQKNLLIQPFLSPRGMAQGDPFLMLEVMGELEITTMYCKEIETMLTENFVETDESDTDVSDNDSS